LFTLREKRRLMVFESRLLRRKFGPEKDKVTGEWRRLHNAKLNDLYSLPNIVCEQIKKNEMGGSCGTYEGEKRCIQNFGGET
jgi:hypothetical protein